MATHRYGADGARRRCRGRLARTAALLTAAVGLTAGVVVAPAAGMAGVTVTRFSGVDRYATSAAVSAATFAGSVNVVFASGEAYPDGLSAAALAGQYDAPVLLVPARGTLPQSIKAEITRLGADTGYLIGGTAAIDAAMATQLARTGLVMRRYAGIDRYDTSRAVTQVLSTVGTDNGENTAFLVTGEDGKWADALAASGPAFATTMPLVVTGGETLNAAARATLTAKAVTRVLLVGGTASISDSVLGEVRALGIEVQRLSGQTREATATALAAYVTADADFGFTTTGVIAVSGTDFVDALSAGPHAGVTTNPIVFVDGSVPAATAAYLQANAATLTSVRLIGGPRAIPDSVVEELKRAAGGTTPPTPAPTAPGPSTRITFGPNQDATVTIGAPSPSADTRTFLAGGLTDGAVYRATLVSAANVTIDATGKVTFAKDGATGLALAGTNLNEANITHVGGTTTNVGGTDTEDSRTATPLNGSLSVTIEGDAVSAYYVVLHRNGAPGNTGNGGISPRLELDAGGVPTETFGVSGKTTFLPAEAPGGTVTTTATISRADDGFLVTATGSYFYDSNDTFTTSGGVPITFAAFTAALSSGDALTGGTYATAPELTSSFVLDDITPVAVTGVDATAVDSDTIEITWTASSPAPDSYTISRKDGAETGVLTDYTYLAAVPVGPAVPRYTDEGVSAQTSYAYAVTAVLDRDESPLVTSGPFAGASADQVSTPSVAAGAAPESVTAALTNDVGFTGELNEGDVWTIGFSRPLDPLESTDLIRVQDPGGESFDFGISGATLNADPSIWLGTAFAPGTLLNKRVGNGAIAVIDRDGVAANNNGRLDYPLTIVNASGYTATLNGVRLPWVPAGDPDTTLETGVAPPYSTLGPTVQSVAFIPGLPNQIHFDSRGDVFEIVFDENLDPPAPGDRVIINGVALENGSNTPFTRTGGGRVLTITWRSGVSILAAKNKVLTAGTGIEGANTGLAARGYPKTVTQTTVVPSASYAAVTHDVGVGAQADAGDVFRVGFDQPVVVAPDATLRVVDGDDPTATAPEETFTITNGVNATFTLNASVVRIGSTDYAAGRFLTVTLTARPQQEATVAGGNNALDITDPSWATWTGSTGIADTTGKPLLHPTADDEFRGDISSPSISPAPTGDASDKTVRLTYTQAVFFENTAATRAQFRYKGATPTAISGSGTTTVLLTFPDGVVVATDDTATLTYTGSATAGARLQGFNTKTAPSPATTAAVIVSP